MYKRRPTPLWIGAIVLSGMLLVGADKYKKDKKPPVPVLITGQTTSYAAGDDGDLQFGVAWPDPRFTDNGDGTVTDNLTNLLWAKDADCHYGNWQSALDFCNALASGACGLTDGSIAGDWRLPNVRELLSLIDYEGWPPVALPTGHPFTDVTTWWYWSSTFFRPYPDTHAFGVCIGNGRVEHNDKNGSNDVWCVRGGQ